MNCESVLSCFGKRLRQMFYAVEVDELMKTEEIRLRLNKPVILKNGNDEKFLSQTKGTSINVNEAAVSSYDDLCEALSLISGYSLYAYEQELKSGYITIEGGHRVGVCGKTVLENNQIKTIKDINSLNIRLAKQIKNCADSFLKYIVEGKVIHNTIIISLPCCGKTTVLRDLIRILSGDRYKKTIGVVDERCELAACFKGEAQNDLGIRCDVLESCPKASGMLMLIRTMSPQVIVVDEIGKSEDILAIHEATTTGVKVICSAHGSNLSDFRKRPMMEKVISERLFERYIILKPESRGEILEVYNERLEKIHESKGG